MKVAIFCVCVFAQIFESECRSNLGIINGDVADIADFPYIVSVLSDGGYICGGSIVTPKYILTAAHCVNDRSGLGVRAGSSLRASGGQTPEVAKVHIHSAYNPVFLSNDIAIIELATELTIEDNVAVITLSNDTKVAGGELGEVAGWGFTSATNENLPDQLRNVTIPLFNDEKCEEVFGGFYSTSLICAGGEYGDTCSGDSGGPLVVNGVQVGIVSYGPESCATTPTIFVRVAAFRSLFIDKIIYSKLTM